MNVSSGQLKRKQPPALYVLFSTEMWERFSFYAMRALLVLYMTAMASEGGLGLTMQRALQVYSYYLGFAYIMPVVGGILADNVLGQRNSVLIGGWLMMIGHLLMAANDVTIFYIAIACVAIGNGFFKPNLTSILGSLYDDKDERRDGGYAIFYMGINIGGVLAGFASGKLHSLYGFDAGFIAAAISMGLSLFIFSATARKYLGDIGTRKNVQSGSQASEPITSIDIDRIKVIGVLTVALGIFIIAFEQLGGLLNIFADRWVDRSCFGFEIPTAYFQSLNPFFIVLLSPLASRLWVTLGDRGPFIATKLTLGLLLATVAFVLMTYIAPTDLEARGDIHWIWLVLQNFFVTSGELCIIPVVWSSVSKLAPKGYTSTFMALSMISFGIGSWLSGMIGSQVESIGFQVLFMSLVAMLALTAFLMFLLTPMLKRWCHGVR